MRHVENLSDTEKDMVCICEPEFGRTLGDEEERRSQYLMNFLDDRDEFSNF